MSDFLGKYRLLAELGRGGMADVYLASSNGVGGFQKLVVVKLSRTGDDPVFAQMFLDEARLSARLSHSNIVQTYEVGEEAGRQFIIMEYLDGPSLYRLNRLAAGQGGVPLRHVVQILSHTLGALHYAHTLKDFDGTPLNVVHRDVSPQNLMLTSNGESKLLDFGISKTSDSRTLTHAGFYRGKLNYMSPEQALGEPVDARADVFSVGVLLAEAITRKPFWGEAPTALVSARLASCDIPDIEEANIEPLLEEICKGALIGKREHRTSSAKEFKDALDFYLSTAGGAVSNEELAAFIAPLIAGDRARILALVDQQLNHGAEGITLQTLPSHRPPPIAYASLTPAPVARSRGSGYTPGVSSVASTATPNVTGSAQVTSVARGQQGQGLVPDAPLGPAPAFGAPLVVPAPPSAHATRWLIGLVGATLVVLLGLVGYLVTRGPSQPPVQAPAAVAPVAPQEPVTPSKPPPGTVEIAIDPPQSTLTIDGTPVANPYELSTLDGKTHQLAASAPGYEVMSRVVTFDRSVTMRVALRALPPAAEAPSPNPPVAAPARPAAAPVAAHHRAPPPAKGAAKRDEADPIQELQPKSQKATNRRAIDTDVFDDGADKKEIDRANPWEN